MKLIIRLIITTILALLTSLVFGQTIKRIDGSKLNIDSLNSKIEYLMKTANVSGVAVSVFNDNKPIFSKTYGLANVQKNITFQKTSVMKLNLIH